MTNIDKLKTPELDKQSEIIKSGKAGVIQEFIDWLREDKKYVLAEWQDWEGYDDQQFVPIYVDPEQLMADFFKIDRDKIETERRAILDALQEDES